MTAHQPYTVISSFDDFEVRNYPESAIAELTVEGSFEQAGTRAFGALAGYINGRNRGGRSIAMTAPVLQGSDTGRSHAIAFVLPADLTVHDAPTPTDARVSVKAVPATTTAALRYTGRWTEESYSRHRAKLLAAVAREGLLPVGEPRFARYNPPFTPWFLRRNEVLVDVARTE